MPGDPPVQPTIVDPPAQPVPGRQDPRPPPARPVVIERDDKITCCPLNSAKRCVVLAGVAHQIDAEYISLIFFGELTD